MSPPSPTRPKRRRTTLTQGGDTPPASIPVDNQPIEASTLGGIPGLPGTQNTTVADPAKRKRQEQHNGHKPATLPLAGSYQQTQGTMLLGPTSAVPGSGRFSTSTQVAQHQTIEVIPTAYHRPSYRADLAKRGYLVRNSLGCGSYSKVTITESPRPINKYAGSYTSKLERM
jgi:hypothetical protein